MAYKIYTKTGDTGLTSLIGGTRVPKHHIRIEAYGTIDELNAFIGLLADTQPEPDTNQLLVQVQNRLFTLGSLLAADPERNKMVLPNLVQADIDKLEMAIDTFDTTLPPLKNFVLPGGHLHVSYCHVARCVCRRAERCMVHLAETEGLPPLALAYINRLSDYLFTLGRHTAHRLAVAEVLWQPEK